MSTAILSLKRARFNVRFRVWVMIFPYRFGGVVSWVLCLGQLLGGGVRFMLRFIAIASTGRAGRVSARHQIKTSRYDGHLVHDEHLSVNSCVVVEGGAQSGKTRALARLHERAEAYWGNERRRKKRGVVRVLHISGREALSDWLGAAAAAGCSAPDGQVWVRMTVAARIAAVLAWIAAEDVRVLIDDAHLVQPGTRRESFVVAALKAAVVWWITASQIERVPQSVRMTALARSPRIVSLGTSASYDHTVILIWGLLAFCAASGAYEVAGLLGLLMIMRRGRGAAREGA